MAQSIGRTHLPCCYCPAGHLRCLKIGATHPEPGTTASAQSEGIPQGDANSRGTAPGAYPGFTGPARGRSRAPKSDSAFTPLTAAEVQIPPDLERSFPSSSGRALTPPPAAVVQTTLIYFFISLCSHCARPVPVSHPHAVSMPSEAARSLPALAASPSCCRVSRHTPGRRGCGGRDTHSPSGCPPPSKAARKSPARRGGALRPQPVACGSKSHYEAKCRGS